jgi:hypothetical protein
MFKKAYLEIMVVYRIYCNLTPPHSFCLSSCFLFCFHLNHRNQTISRKGANIISRRPSHGHLARRCCPQAFFCGFFLK